MALQTVNHVCSVFLRQVVRRMKDLEITHAMLADRMKVSRPYITKLLQRDVNFSFSTAMKMAKALQMDFIPQLAERKVAPDPVEALVAAHGAFHRRIARA